MKKNKIYFENLKYTNKTFIKQLRNIFYNTLQSGKYILSDNVIKFEKEFSKYIGTKFCLGVGNCLDALTISLLALNLPKNSEVIVASNSYVACVLAVVNAGLKPVLAEPALDTYNLNISEFKKKINNRTRAVIALHLYGKPCDIMELKKICKKKKNFCD